MTALYLLLTLGVGVAIIASIINTQWVHGEEWRALGKKREAGERIDPARRGIIYSSDGKILATTVTECDFYLDLGNDIALNSKGQPEYDKQNRPKETGPIVDSIFDKYLDSVCTMLNNAVPSRTADYYRDRILAGRAKHSRCYLVQRKLPYSVWLEISRVPGWNGGVVKSVDGQSVIHQERAHIYGNMAGNTIGFRNSKVDNSYTGLEGYYDSILRGQDGMFTTRRLTKGLWLPDEPQEGKEVPRRTDNDEIDTIIVRKRIDGNSIVSTIDTRYQDIAESSLRSALRTYGGTAGCAILMEMQTGYVLACVNLAVDTAAHDYLEVRDRNIAVSDVYEPGSTFKTVILTAMLNDPAITIDTAMQLKSGYKDFGGKYGVIKDDHTLAGRDSLNVREVIEQSSNVGMSDLGWMYYKNRRDTLAMLVHQIFPYAKMEPDVKAPEYETRINNLKASNRDFLNFCYGYSTKVSPLRLITFYNALGAGGRMVKPLFCRALIKDGRKTEVKPIVMNKQAMSKQSAAMMKDMLEGVVEHGTGNNIKNNTYGIAGKTGTAVHSYANLHRYNASFAGFFPSESPRYTCLVVMEDVPSYGRQAAIVFKAISDCVVAIDKSLSDGAVKSARPKLEVDSSAAMQRPTLARGNREEIMALYKRLKMPMLSDESSSTWVYYKQPTDSTQAQYVAYEPDDGKVPNCKGMTAKDAIALLHSKGYRVRINGYGKVKSQTPLAGQVLKSNGRVELTLK